MFCNHVFEDGAYARAALWPLSAATGFIDVAQLHGLVLLAFKIVRDFLVIKAIAQAYMHGLYPFLVML